MAEEEATMKEEGVGVEDESVGAEATTEEAVEVIGVGGSRGFGGGSSLS